MDSIVRLQLDFLEELSSKGKISISEYNELRKKANLMEIFGINAGDLLLLTRTLPEAVVVELYNEKFDTNYEEVLDYKVDSTLINFKGKFRNITAYPLAINSDNTEVKIATMNEKGPEKRQLELELSGYKISSIQCFKVAFKMLSLRFGSEEDELLKKYTAEDKLTRIIIDAIEDNSTDIHIGCYYDKDMKKHKYLCKFRIATELESWDRFPLTEKDNKNIINNLQIRTKGGLSQGSKTIQGIEDSIEDIFKDGKWAARVTIGPCRGGSHSVIRLHRMDKTAMGIEKLGFHPNAQKMILELSNKEEGSLWILGKTGAGKNTTVYSILDWISCNKKLDIVEFSNPVEVNLNCIQKEFKTQEELITLLRRLKKEDPDIVFIGEISDASIAVPAKELMDSNVMVITTTHTERVWGFPQKIYNYYGENYRNVLSNVNGLVYQVMFKSLCDFCKEEIEDPTDHELDQMIRLGVSKAYRAHKGGCRHCKGGYNTAKIFPQAEVVTFDLDLVSRLMKNKTPIDMSLDLRNYMLEKKLNLEVYLKDYIENGVIDLISVERRNLMERGI